MGNVLIHWKPNLFVEDLGVPEGDRALLLREVFGSVEWIQRDRGTLSMEDGLDVICRRLPELLRQALLAGDGHALCRHKLSLPSPRPAGGGVSAKSILL